jgi:hypothetical protein
MKTILAIITLLIVTALVGCVVVPFPYHGHGGYYGGDRHYGYYEPYRRDGYHQ